MASKKSDDSVSIRATRLSYFAVGGIWILLAGFCLLLSIRSPGEDLELCALMTAGFAIVWWIWLLRMKLSVSDGYVEYRDGIFRSSKIALRLIADIRDENIEWDSRVLNRIPRVIVLNKNGDISMLINARPFSRNDLQKLLQAIKRQMR